MFPRHLPVRHPRYQCPKRNGPDNLGDGEAPRRIERQNIATGITYAPFGPVTGLTFGNGITGTYSFDNDYRATSRADAFGSNFLNLGYTYDAANNVKTITDAVNAANSQTLNYDVLDRLTSASSGSGGYGSYSWTWDAVSNVKTQVINGTTTTFNLTAGSNQLASIVTGSTTQNVTNTAAGKLLSENDLHSGQTADYIYLNGKPIGEVNPTNGRIYFMHTDSLGTPDRVTDSTKTVVWNAIYNPFGDNPIGV